MKRTCLGIDLGGTYIKFGLLDADRTPGATLQLPTPTGEGSDGVVRQMIAGAEQALAEAGLHRDDLLGIGIGAPGPLDLDAGVVIAMPNVPGMEDAPLRDRLSEAFGCRAVLENDANAAAYGEYVCGAGKEARDMVMVTLGTGVGSGIVLDGRVLHGAHGIGAELGHMIIEPDGEVCGCGQRGCLERYCSATYIGRYAAGRIRDGEASSLAAVLAKTGELTAKDINVARRDGDALAAEVWQRGAYYLALACVNICRIFDPDEIVLAGGMILAGDDLMAPLVAEYERLRWSLTPRQTDIAFSTLGADAGVIGAAGVAWQAFDDTPDT
ncbi:MAG: ROK family protein [Planctomycetota bacterium]